MKQVEIIAEEQLEKALAGADHVVNSDRPTTQRRVT
jgi:hypothetical protein